MPPSRSFHLGVLAGRSEHPARLGCEPSSSPGGSSGAGIPATADPDTPSRRAVLTAACAALASALAAPSVLAADYRSPREALDAIERLAADVRGRVRALCEVPFARDFAMRLLADHERQQADRRALRARLGLAPAASFPNAPTSDRSLSDLRGAQEALTFAQAEALPALPDGPAVALLAHHLVTSARHLTLIDLWIEAEEQRG